MCRGFQSLSVQYLFSGAFGPVKYLLGEATGDYGAADMTKGMFRKTIVIKVSFFLNNPCHGNIIIHMMCCVQYVERKG
jgi:hypothetical protein